VHGKQWGGTPHKHRWGCFHALGDSIKGKRGGAGRVQIDKETGGMPRFVLPPLGDSREIPTEGEVTARHKNLILKGREKQRSPKSGNTTLLQRKDYTGRKKKERTDENKDSTDWENSSFGKKQKMKGLSLGCKPPQNQGGRTKGKKARKLNLEREKDGRISTERGNRYKTE